MSLKSQQNHVPNGQNSSYLKQKWVTLPFLFHLPFLSNTGSFQSDSADSAAAIQVIDHHCVSCLFLMEITPFPEGIYLSLDKHPITFSNFFLLLIGASFLTQVEPSVKYEPGFNLEDGYKFVCCFNQVLFKQSFKHCTHPS
ncbi:hypothetical protein AMECASPLE_034316 [Ameca splendens]|uniref:Uncharacterized protein n=1 Tax=Ameca splendens TaxID=208324 RepID=A0ABV0Y749_9TELE